MKILSSPWRRAFFLISIIARLPLGALPVILVLGTLESGGSVARAGALVAAISIGAALTGFLQGPAFDRFSLSWLYILLALASLLSLALLAFYVSSPLAFLFAALYGILRPHTSTVTRVMWLHEFRSDPPLGRQAVALDIATGPALVVLSPIVAGGMYALFSFSGSILALALLTLISSLSLFFLMISRAREIRPSDSHFFSVIGRIIHFSPFRFLLFSALLSSAAGGSFIILLSAQLDLGGNLNWFVPLMIINALGVALGSLLYKRFSEEKYLSIFLLAETAGLGLYLLAFLLPPAGMIPFLLLGSLALVPLTAAFYVVAEKRGGEGNRAASFSLLASAQFTGGALGQALFSEVAQTLSPLLAMAGVVALQGICWALWSLAKSGQKHETG